MIKNPHELHYKMLLHVDNILKSFSATCFSLSTEFSELTNADTCPLVIVFNFTQFYKASGIWLNHLYVTLHCQWCLLQLYTLYFQICQLLWHLYSNSIPLFKISKVIAQKYTKRASNKKMDHQPINIWSSNHWEFLYVRVLKSLIITDTIWKPHPLPSIPHALWAPSLFYVTVLCLTSLPLDNIYSS